MSQQPVENPDATPAGAGAPAGAPAGFPAADTPGPVNWPMATSLAARMARPGPLAPRADLASLVESLRDAAARAVPAVLQVTGMTPAVAGQSDGLGQVYVVDRPRWAQANVEVMAAMTSGVRFPSPAGDQSGEGIAMAGAVELGAVLAMLSSRVLGQFDPYSARVPAPGRLLMVAPNVLAAERAMHVEPDDFRLWVCLHEQTHALQFSAAPWLAGHLRERTQVLLGQLTETSRRFSEARWRERFVTVLKGLAHVVTGSGTALMESVLEPAERELLANLTAVMALLEGHADVAMDAVGPDVVPTVADIRDRFEARRDGSGRPAADAVLRRVMGMDAKIAQYRDGARFVREVEKSVGRDGLNAVWTGPDALPSAREIADPRAWVRRVHG